MQVRYITRYKVSTSENGEPYLSSEKILQQFVTVKTGPLTYDKNWVDVETFEDYESKEKAIEDLKKLGINVDLKF